MKFVFAYDVQVEQTHGSNEVYHNYFDYNVWKRYLQACSELTVVTRIIELGPGQQPVNRKLSSGPNVTFQAVPNLSNPIAQLTNRKQARAIIQQQLEGADALIARLPSEIGAEAIRVANRMGKPWAVEVVGHAWDALWNYGTWQGKVYAPIMTLRTKRLVKQASYALYVTRSFLQGHYPTKGRTIHCSNVEVGSAPREVLRDRLERIKQRYTASGEAAELRIGLVGSLASKYKGVDIAIQAIAQLKDLNVSFHVLGEGDQSRWRRYADQLGVSDRIVFHDPVPSGTEVQKWLDKLDMYMQPSFQEGLPRALIEAMSRALPSIGSTAGGIPELLPEQWITPKGNWAELADKIRLLAASPELMQEAAVKNYEEAGQYSNEVLNARRTAFWESFAQDVRQQSRISVAKLVEG
ncbi:glycosyltransferase [Paenibacillus sp. UMB4589-SE434]|uniref:glycosyltransferase n=1 Tax=Paenibacillus sp. UMB4589-SE434 TaxID=3046314 RepID=UPI00254CF918|nr:glycosyltransferase [Paenibacillus sp. UMB4589-SE434]MDK8182005.1 glycosyltransferase [Paenibacillus sp. UMB4589-SE434]